MRKWIGDCIRLTALCALLVPLFLFTACDEGPAPAVGYRQPAISAKAAPTAPARSQEYTLGIDDKVHITVFNEPNLSGDFQVASTGIISMPLIGDVRAAGYTTIQVQNEIIAKLANGYMKSPHVSIEVSSYRPFFILGEVMKPGSYTYVNGMTVVNAVALAGGYTYRADKDGIKLKHGGLNGTEETAQEGTQVFPGDVVTVPERFF